MNVPCRSHDPRSTTCRDGFIQKPFCHGQGGCIQCGNIATKSIPYCLRDEVPAHFVKDDGSPLFYRGHFA